MDAREQLRRFLEQRREMGESELILDSLSVDEVLRVVGANPDASGATARPRRAALEPSTQSSDWRELMRASDAAQAAVKEAASVAVDASRESAPAAPAAQTRSTVAPAMPGHAPEGPVRPAASPAPAIPAASPASRIPGIDAPLGLVVGPSERDMFNPFASLTSLEELAATIAKCTRCPLFATAKNPVPGQGNPNADFVCVGEAPGANEDEQGLAFVGQAGGLLTKILEAVNLRRDDVFICNVLKHRPPGNRNPQPLEVEACAPYLVRQLELIRPKVILALGTFAAQTLLNTKLSIGKLRGSVHRYYGIPTIVTYHPAALLRNPAWKRPTWEDVQLARRILDSASARA